MSEDTLTLQGVLSSLEGLNGRSDDALHSDKHHYNQFKYLKIILSQLNQNEITAIQVDKAIRICSMYSTDLQCIPYVLSIINLLVSKDIPNVDYLQSALTTLEILRLKCIEQEAKNIRTFALKIFLSHSKTTLNLLVCHYCPVLIETFGVFLQLSPSIPNVLDIKMEAFVLLELLNILEPGELYLFVKEGIPLWLSGVVPTIIEFLVNTNDTELARSKLRLVESLADEMIKLDYFKYPEWKIFLKSVVIAKKVPASITSLLMNGQETWHIIWIVIIKLLKSFVTRNYESIGTPINSMLPVVETAFKMEPKQRVRSFACWNELIENFSRETNPNCLLKRIKLLIVPLRLNNAKTEDVVQAKFNTWWLMIRKFKPRLDIFTNEVLVPFLQFILGKEQSSKPMFWAGQLPSLKKQCLEAFVEIVGHDQLGCQCSIDIPRLGGKIISTIMIINQWKMWLTALKAAIRLVPLDCDEVKVLTAPPYHIAISDNLRCVWMSLVVLASELPDNAVRRDIFNDLINALAVVLQDNNKPTSLPAVIVEVLVLPLFRDNRIKTLLNSRSEEHRPMHKVVSVILDKSFDDYYTRCSPQELQKIFDPIVWMIVNESVSTPAYLIWLLDELPKTNSSMKLWRVLAQTVSETNLCLQVFNAILRWPLKAMHDCTEIKEAAAAWYTLYNIVHIKLEKIGFDNEITKIIMKTGEENKATVYFVLFALIGVMKHIPDQEKMAKLDSLTNKILNWDYEENILLLPSLVDTLVLMIEKISTSMDETLAQSTINCVRNVFTIIKSDTQCSEKVSTTSKTTFTKVKENIYSINKTVLFDTLMSAMKTFVSNSSGQTITNDVRDIISFDDSPKKRDVISKEFASPKLQGVKKKKKEPKIVSTFVENGEVYVEVKSNWKFNPKNLTENQKEKLQKKRDNIPALYQDLSQSQDEIKLTSWKPDSQDTSISSSKSAASNGASEILKHIQSADVVPKIMENLLVINKQQNACDTVSPARSASPVPSLLPALAASPVCTVSPSSPARAASPVTSTVAVLAAAITSPPNRIIASTPPLMSPVSPARISLPALISSCVSSVSPARASSPAPKDTSGKVNKAPTPKSIKSPRMALKDRIYRNMRNLIEKSSPSQQTLDEDHQVPVNIIENIALSNATNVSEIKVKNKMVEIAKPYDLILRQSCTPATKIIDKEDLNITKLEPLLPLDRPSRVKRTPKKFDNTLLLDIKKRRTVPLSDSQHSQDNNIEKLKSDLDAKATKQSTNSKLVVGNEFLDENIIQYDIFQCQNNREINETADVALILSPTTPIVKKNIDMSPEKPSTVREGEVPGDKNEASEVNKDNTLHSGPNVIVEVLPLETTPLCLIRETVVLKSNTKNIDLQNENTKNQDTIMTPLIKTRKTKALFENSVKQNTSTAVVTNPQPQSPIKTNNLDQQKSLETEEKLTVKVNKVHEKSKENNNDAKNNIKEIVLTTPNTKNKNKQKSLETEEKITGKVNKVHQKSKEYNNDAKNNIEEIVSTTPNTKNKNKQKSLETEEKLTAKVNKVNQKSKEYNNDAKNNKEEIVTTTPKTKDQNKLKSLETEEKSTVKENKIHQKSKENNNDAKNNIEETVSTTPKSKVKDATQTSTAKKTGKKSLIEKQLRIDTVEGHPLLKEQTGKRLTRKQISEAENNKSNGRKRLFKIKLDLSKAGATPKTSKKAKENTSPKSNCMTVEDSQDKNSFSKDATVDNPPCSEDIIESSQDSTMTTISVKSKPLAKRLVVALEIINVDNAINTQDLIQDSDMTDVSKKNHDATDIEISQNKTAEVQENTIDLTEDMDTEPMNGSSDVEFLSDTIAIPVPVPEVTVGPETQELAKADTLPNDPLDLLEFTGVIERQPLVIERRANKKTKEQSTDNDITQSLPETPLAKTNEASSPFKDDELRKQDFLNNTIQISPIKMQSPEKEKKSLSPETSSDFVVVRLSSPVHCNGEPYEKHGSPEFFSEDRASPDKRNASPPRPEAAAASTSPNSSLSLKKNRPQVRPSGRAAHMLGLLCVSDDKVKKLSTSTEPEAVKKTSTPAKRNLRILYNSVGDKSETGEQSSVPVSSDSEFLQLSRALPTVTSSPSGPILKRKLADITDEATISPASKTKRVSFHDPPVSTTISVHKYIDDLCHSPQSSKKRGEKSTRQGAKSPKRLENAFILDTVLSNAVESFAETSTPADDTQNISLDTTPAVEVVITSDLNDTHPICPELVDCEDPIDAISLELSSPAMRELLVKELAGKIETIGDLAKMTELEVNRLCIKAPKIQVAKKVLEEYAVKRPCAVETVVEEAFSEPLTETLLDNKTASVEVQCDAVELLMEMQVDVEPSKAPMALASTQTDGVVTTHAGMQTDESGSKTTADIVSTCLSDRDDFVPTLTEKLDIESKKIIAKSLPVKAIFDVLLQQDNSTPPAALNEPQSKDVPKKEKTSAELSFLRKHLHERYEDTELILLCSQLLQDIGKR